MGNKGYKDRTNGSTGNSNKCNGATESEAMKRNKLTKAEEKSLKETRDNFRKSNKIK